MPRFTLLLLGSALMLIVAACDTNGDDDGIDDTADDMTELPADDQEPEDTDVVVPEDDDDAVGVEPDDDAAAEDDDPLAQTDEEAVQPDDAEEIDPEDMQPGPEDGYFLDLDFDEANDLTEFELKEPASVPESVEFQTIMAMASPEAPEEERSEQATTVTFSYSQPPEDEMMQGLPVELTQTIEMDMSEGLGPEADQEEVTIGDRDVNRVTITDESGYEILAFMWSEDEVYFSLAAILGEELEESELEDMVASIPAS